MTIQNFPAILQPIIQQGFLEHQFKTALESVLAYRAVADREEFMTNIGETITKTRAGLLSPNTTPLSASATNTNFDNGLSPQNWTVEQYSLSLQQYGGTMDLNTVTEAVGIQNRFVANSFRLGMQAAQSFDRLARDALFNGYFAGNTRVRTTLGAPGTAVAVDDIRGFQYVYNLSGFTSASQLLGAGAPSPTQAAVSASNPLTVTIGSNAYTVTGVVADVVNVSTAPNGISGVLTTSNNVTVADGTAANSVVASNATAIFRPSGRTNTAALQSTDVLTMSVLLDTVAQLRNNAVPTINGVYNCYLDFKSARQLFADSDFRQLYQGATGSNGVFKKGMPVDMLGLAFYPTTETYIQAHPSISGATVRRPIICGQGALIEGDYAGQNNRDAGNPIAEIYVADGISHIVRSPVDRLQQIVGMSYEFITSFCAPTDILTNNTIIPTASNAALKRAAIIEHIG